MRTKKSLDEAEELRMKENKAFHAEETDLLEAIDASEYAITALSKHHTSLAQVPTVAERLRRARVSELAAAGGLPGSQREALRNFLSGVVPAAPKASFLQIPGFQSYAPQSGQIFGILEQLAKDFKDSLAEAQSVEKKAVEQFNMLKSAKEVEIATAKETISQLDEDIADTTEQHAQAVQQLEDTEKQVALDTEFLANLKKKCAASDAEFEERVKSRTEEIAAVEDTIAILNTDESFDVAETTVNTFLQVASSDGEEQKARRRQAAYLVRQAAARTGEPRLVMLAASVQLDAFTEVKQKIDVMIAELTTQNKEEIEKRDWCTEELNTNKRETDAAYDKKASLETKIAELENTIDTLKADISETTAAIAKMEAEMKKSSEIREAENADYQQTMTDQRVMQMILNKALERMKQVYAMLQQPGAPHIQTSGTHTDPGNGPARFTAYETNPSGGKVVAMIEKVIADAEKTTDEAQAAEQDAQAAYEGFMKESNDSITAYKGSIASMSEALAKAKEELLQEKADFDATMKTLEGLDSEATDLHKSCDYVLKNFAARQEARTAEIDALTEAKNILSGMK